ncbi:hypothetical protein E2C01_074385 [Portunus trituberculatus]|uniref:Uncharacterized protein n=1 Tax=Portunus trituberculatus TaxID=210409 RepID=A0A5B7ID23_PORTR|nr:hypothetical protein [Portunus trituberculatus]
MYFPLSCEAPTPKDISVFIQGLLRVQVFLLRDQQVKTRICLFIIFTSPSSMSNERKKGDGGLLQKLLPCCFGLPECLSCVSTAASNKAHKTPAKTEHKTKAKGNEKGGSGVEITKGDRKKGKKHKHALSTPAILLLAALLTFMQALAILYTVFYLPS